MIRKNSMTIAMLSAAFVFGVSFTVRSDMVITLKNGKRYTVPIQASDIDQIIFREGVSANAKNNRRRQRPPTSGSPFRVGASAPYKAPSEIAGLVGNNYIIEIEAGDYPNDVAIWRQSNIVIRGVGGRARLIANGNAAEGKAIWVIKGNNVIIENIEFSGARVADRNGAGIRFEGTNLTIRNCYFHDNEMGLLTGKNPASEITIENSEFANNTVDYRRYGRLGHNIYVGEVKRFTLQGSYIHDANIGHNVKSRARENFIYYNRIMDEKAGSSYLIDLANGGDAYIIGNTLHQSPLNDNNTLVSYAAEGNREIDSFNIHIVNNTLVSSDREAQFIWNRSASSSFVSNNLFVGRGKTLIGKGELKSNLHLKTAKFSNAKIHDFHLLSDSKAVDQGIRLPQTTTGISLTPDFQYAHPTRVEKRPISGKIDIGAFEFSKK